MEEKTEANKCEFQAQLEEVKAIAKWGSRPAVCVSAAQPQTCNRNTSWAMFWCQFETVAEHNHWSHQEKSMYLIIALKG
jgi:hypothetical protein